MTTQWLTDLDRELDAAPGTVSVWYGPLGGAAVYTRRDTVAHNAASTMKVAVLAALHREVEAGRLTLDAPVTVHNSFASALAGAPRFGCDEAEDSDPSVWQRMGGTASLSRLAERMIIRSGNLATNLVMEQLPAGAPDEVWRAVGATHSTTPRGIDDGAARRAGIMNMVTAADLARLLTAIALGAAGDTPPGGALAGQASCDAMLGTLLRQEWREDLALGLPDDTPIAHKNGWITGVRHSGGVVYPADADPYVLVVCTTDPDGTDADDPAACALLGRVSAACWAARHDLAVRS